MKNKKIILINIIIFLVLILLLLFIPVIISLSSSYTVLVKGKETGYFKARDLLVVGDIIVCQRDSMEYFKKTEAMDAEADKYAFSVLSMKNIVSIEKIPDEESEEGNKQEKAADVAKSYLGVYKIDVSGNPGYLYLSRYKKTGKIFGTVRFPDWAHGVFEPLKNLWIKNGKLGFIRSIETIEERRRVGAPNFFTQEYYGEYKEEGNAIEGYYINRGAKMMWRGYKVKRK